MKTLRLNLELVLPTDTCAYDVVALLAAVKYVLRAFFPKATVKVEGPHVTRPPSSTLLM